MRPEAGWLLPLMGAAIVGAEFRSHKAKVTQKKKEYQRSWTVFRPTRLYSIPSEESSPQPSDWIRRISTGALLNVVQSTDNKIYARCQ